MRELRPLRLPQLVEARRKRESQSTGAETPDSPSIGHTLYPSRSLPSPEAASPLTPTFSARSHTRFPSLSSSPSPTSSPTMRESFDGFGASKRPLTEVKEEPQERDEDYETEYNRLAHTKNGKSSVLDSLSTCSISLCQGHLILIGSLCRLLSNSARHFSRHKWMSRIIRIPCRIRPSGQCPR